MPDWDSMVVVGRVARTHGIRGHVLVNPETDFVAERFHAGAEVWTRVNGLDTQQATVGQHGVSQARAQRGGSGGNAAVRRQIFLQHGRNISINIFHRDKGCSRTEPCGARGANTNREQRVRKWQSRCHRGDCFAGHFTKTAMPAGITIVL